MSGSRVLVLGLMGTGKSTVGRRLAQHLGTRFLDNDELVRRATGAEREDLLRQGGEDALRTAESAALGVALTEPSPVVAAVAAGVVLDRGDRDRIRDADAVVVWLRARPETLAERTAHDHQRPTRPWLGDDARAVFARMASERSRWFDELADVVVDVDELTPDEIVGRVLPHVPGA